MIEAPEPVHTPHSDDHPRRWFDVAMAVAVLLVSAGSLYVALHTGQTMEALVEANERLVRSQSTPVLQYSHGNVGASGEAALTFDVTNVGTGPARIVSFRLTHEGRTYSNVGKWLVASGKGQMTFTSAPINRIVLAPNASVTMANWRRPEDASGLARWQMINRERFKAKVEACYCSVFDQCWKSNLEADIPREVPSCGAGDANGG